MFNFTKTNDQSLSDAEDFLVFMELDDDDDPDELPPDADDPLADDDELLESESLESKCGD